MGVQEANTYLFILLFILVRGAFVATELGSTRLMIFGLAQSFNSFRFIWAMFCKW